MIVPLNTTVTHVCCSLICCQTCHSPKIIPSSVSQKQTTVDRYRHSHIPNVYDTLFGYSLDKRIVEEKEQCLEEKQWQLKRSINGHACPVLFNEPLPGEGIRGRSIWRGDELLGYLAKTTRNWPTGYSKLTLIPHFFNWRGIWGQNQLNTWTHKEIRFTHREIRFTHTFYCVSGSPRFLHYTIINASTHRVRVRVSVGLSLC